MGRGSSSGRNDNVRWDEYRTSDYISLFGFSSLNFYSYHSSRSTPRWSKFPPTLIEQSSHSFSIKATNMLVIVCSTLQEISAHMERWWFGFPRVLFVRFRSVKRFAWSRLSFLSCFLSCERLSWRPLFTYTYLYGIDSHSSGCRPSSLSTQNLVSEQSFLSQSIVPLSIKNMGYDYFEQSGSVMSR